MVLSEEERKRRQKEYSKKHYHSEKNKLRLEANKNNEEFKKKNRKACKKWYNTEAGYKSKKKREWKQRGLNMKHFEIIYLLYLGTTNCDICNCILTDGKPIKSTTKCMDHSHKTGKFRNILCSSCNTKRGEDNF